jgi:DNA-directed RNA polymerase specialized sigma24 family protein
MANLPLGGYDLSEVDAGKRVDEARNLLESVVLLETVAVEREAKAENIVESLTEEGMKPEEVAERLDIPDAAVQTMLQRDQPNLPHERMGVSEETVARLDPFRVKEA